MMSRQRATCSGASTLGICTIMWTVPSGPMSPSDLVGQRCPPSRGRHDVASEILGIIVLVSEVVDIELKGRLVVDLVAHHGVELPIVGHEGGVALVGEGRRLIGRTAAERQLAG